MKLLYFIGFLLIIACHSPGNKNKLNSNEVNNFITENLEAKSGKAFFDFDAVDYYHSDMDENTAANLINQQKTAIDSIQYNLIIDETSEDISNAYFINNLEKAGFKKIKIESADFKNLNQLFSEKAERDGLNFACIPIFRDILVFKKNDKVTGVAKICFGCNDYKIIGTDANTSNFGQGKDYEILSLILNKYIDKN